MGDKIKEGSHLTKTFVFQEGLTCTQDVNPLKKKTDSNSVKRCCIKCPSFKIFYLQRNLQRKTPFNLYYPSIGLHYTAITIL